MPLNSPALHISDQADAVLEATLRQHIRDFNDRHSPQHRLARATGARPLNIALRDASNALLGGLLGDTLWGWLRIAQLWVHKDWRQQGWGSAMLAAAENEARARGCHAAEVRTFSFQARGFYEKEGYRVIGALSDYPPGETLYWLRKDFAATGARRTVRTLSEVGGQIQSARGTILIRPARLDDMAAYRELRLRALQQHPLAFCSAYEVSAAYPDSTWLGRLQALGEQGQMFFATHDERLIGMSGVFRGDSPKTAHSATVVSVYVEPAWRGLHIAEGMIESCAAWARAHGVSVLKLGVSTDNLPAIRCYERCGFRVYGLEPQAIRAGGTTVDEWLMARHL